MARPPQSRPRARATIETDRIPWAIKKLQRRLSELERLQQQPEEWLTDGASTLLSSNINAAIDEVFGQDTADAADFSVNWTFFSANRMNPTQQDRLAAFSKGLVRASNGIRSAIERLEERQRDANEDGSSTILRAYEGLELHPEIARAASDLYRDGHYSNAIRDAVIALNDLVRLRSGESKDGANLMEFVFNPNNPVLKFNALADESDRNEQLGFMKMLAGAVAGLRNPRAHSLIEDDAERALEFIHQPASEVGRQRKTGSSQSLRPAPGSISIIPSRSSHADSGTAALAGELSDRSG